MTGTHTYEPRKRPTQRRSQLTYQHILDGAAQVFEERGYGRGTTNHIAERAGVSIGSLYQYFPSKDAILAELVNEHVRRVSALLEEFVQEAIGRPTGLAQTLRRFVDAILSMHAARPGLHRVLFDEAPHPPTVRSRRRKARQTQVAAVCRLLQVSPEVRVRSAQDAAYLTAILVEALTHQYVLYPPRGMTDRRFVDEVVVLLSSYLSRSGP